MCIRDRYIAYAVNGESWTDVPLFIKEGAIIPTQKVLDYVDEESITELEIDIFPDSVQSQFLLYDDDGSSYDYEDGVFFKQSISARDNGCLLYTSRSKVVQAKAHAYPIHIYLRLPGRAGRRPACQPHVSPLSRQAGGV